MVSADGAADPRVDTARAHLPDHMDLPLLPMVIARMAMLDEDSESFADDVLALAGADPTLFARLMHMATRGAQPGVGRPADTLSVAVTRMGASRLADVVRVRHAMRTFVPVVAGERFLWFHVLEAAAGARILAGLDPQSRVDPEFAFALGMMHDLGRFVMFDEAPGKLAAVNETEWLSFDTLLATEEDLVGFNHSILGMVAVETWKLPDSFELPLRHHHHYDDARWPKLPDGHALALKYLQMADVLSLVWRDPSFRAGSAGERERHLARQYTSMGMKNLPIPVGRVVSKIDEIMARAAEGCELIGIRPDH